MTNYDRSPARRSLPGEARFRPPRAEAQASRGIDVAASFSARLIRVAIAWVLLLAAMSADAAQDVVARLDKESVAVEVDGKLFTRYKFVNKFGKKPYFWPLAGPVSGRSVTTESSNPYPHHNSMWFGCDHINGGDYWHHQNPKGKQRSQGPRILVASGQRVVFEDVCDWNPPDGATVMRDFRRVTVTAPDAATRIIDFVVVWVPLEKVRITKTNHSLFALRMTPELSVKGGGTMVTSGGETGEKGTFGKTAPWMDHFGTRANWLQLAALRGLVTANPDAGGALLGRALSSDDIALREGATTLIAEVQGEAITRLATSRLTGISPAEQIKMLAALERRGDRSAAPAVAALLAAADANVRATACRALGALGDASVVPALVQTLGGEPGERDMAAEALSRMSGDGVTAALLRQLGGTKGESRVYLVRVLAKRGDPVAAPTLLRLTGDETLYRHALKALGTVGTKAELETLICELGTDEGTAAERRPNEVCIAAICRRLAGDASASGTCLAALATAKPAGRASLYRVLGRLQDEEALAAIVKGTTEADETVRDAAVRALVDWPRESALKPILGVARSSDGLTHHVLALRGYARLLKSLTEKSPVELKPLYDAGAAAARRPEEKQLLDYDIQGVPIRELRVKSKGAYKVHWGGLAKGASWSTDREYTFEEIPVEIANATYIESFMNDRTIGGDEFLSFLVDVPVDVYVAYDSRCRQLPGWLQGWERLKSRIRPPAKTSCTLVLHRKRFDKGKVVLGGCKAPGCSAMYVVAVKKARSVGETSNQ